MKKKFYFLLLSLFALAFFACNDDDNPSSKEIEVGLESNYQTVTLKRLSITPTVGKANLTYSWILSKNPIDNVTDSVLGKTKDLDFLALYAGEYELTLEVADGAYKGRQTTTIQVSEEPVKYDPYITAIYDYDPAPGTFSNECYKKEGATKEDVMKIALGRIDRTSVGFPLDLGNFGGSIVVGFDHTVINVPGKRDLRVYGKPYSPQENPYQYPAAPGIVFVAYDKNGNGKPDADEWYEIKGSAHEIRLMDANFSITYHRPAPDKAPIQIGSGDVFYDRESVLCKTSNNEEYFLTAYKKNHDLCPLWTTEKELTYTGRRLDVGLTNVSKPGQFTLFKWDTLDWGYVGANDPDIDIDWAVDKDGKSVHLPGVDFIKIVNCVSTGEIMMYSANQNSMNTKFSGAADLHILEKYKLKSAK